MTRQNCGYIILYAYQLKENEEIVLGKNSSGMFVTWMTKGEDYFWGHYFSNELEAIKDFGNRIEDWERMYKNG